jgi:hypothetical protein
LRLTISLVSVVINNYPWAAARVTNSRSTTSRPPPPGSGLGHPVQHPIRESPIIRESHHPRKHHRTISAPPDDQRPASPQHLPLHKAPQPTRRALARVTSATPQHQRNTPSPRRHCSHSNTGAPARRATTRTTAASPVDTISGGEHGAPSPEVPACLDRPPDAAPSLEVPVSARGERRHPSQTPTPGGACLTRTLHKPLLHAPLNEQTTTTRPDGPLSTPQRPLSGGAARIDRRPISGGASPPSSHARTISGAP